MLEKQGIEKIQLEKDQEFAKKVSKKYEEKPMIRVLRIRTQNCRSISYPPQLFSLASLIVFVLWFCSDYHGYSYWGLLILLSLLATAWEAGKRYLIIETYDGAWNPNRKWKLVFIPVVLILVAGSFAGSYKGGDEFMKGQITPPTLVHNSKIDSIKAKIEESESLVASLQNTTWKKKVTRTANKGINLTQELQIQRQSEIERLEAEDKLLNDEIKSNHDAKKTSLGFVLGTIAGSMDIILLLLLGFAEHFETQADKLLRKMYQDDSTQSPSFYQQIPTASKTAASQPISENKREIGFKIPKKVFKPTQKQVTQADTQMTQKEVTQPENRVARMTQPDTQMTQPVKDPDYVVKMKKRIRQRWARSFEEHSQAPKSANTRKDLRELALEEWKELEQMGYKITKDTALNPWGLKFVSPQKQ